MHARFQSFVCSIAKSTLELGFQGLVKGVDGFVFSNICDVARNLGSIYKRNFEDAFVEYLHLPQNSTSPAGTGPDGQACRPRFWARTQT